jgi:iron only hydrogenase large subunit-like protein
MIKEAGIEFQSLPERTMTSLWRNNRASVIFGTTGGVIEAVLRTAYEWITGEELKKVEFENLRGTSGLRRATVQIGDRRLRIGIASDWEMPVHYWKKSGTVKLIMKLLKLCPARGDVRPEAAALPPWEL